MTTYLPLLAAERRSRTESLTWSREGGRKGGKEGGREGGRQGREGKRRKGEGLMKQRRSRKEGGGRRSIASFAAFSKSGSYIEPQCLLLLLTFAIVLP